MSSLTPISILIVHQNPSEIKGIDDLLQKKLYRTKKISNSGIKALRHILTKKPDIVILNHELSYLNALDIIKIVSKKELTTEFILISDKNIQITRYIKASSSIISTKNILQEVEKVIKKRSKN
ncbi:response regulator [Aquimarina spinulae]|jgi:DNA-binding response OmpR family regulator|uniref:response regulator n=1 Tax=Aquimarina spinulae TaxID=1192023 RepID=UPI000D55E59D|nr:response regulator [Aquimarina spinulae]